MQISLNWLKKYIDGLDEIDPKELGLKLTMATVEVESIVNQADLLSGVVVGKITKLEKHPDADRLQIAYVDIQEKEVKVVCGGSNLSEGMLVALAQSGAKVRWHGEGDLIELKPTKVRGVESEGMICASSEISLTSLFPAKEDSEIVDLSELNLEVGAPLAKVLGLDDVLYEIDNKSLTNRPDLWGHYGMAREVSAIYNLKLKDYKIEKFKTKKEIDLKIKIKNNADCSRYIGVALQGVKIGESPKWLKKNLEAVGQKSINNIVDITNYIMFDLGQPLHAFSADKIIDQEIIVRRADNKEKVITLDGEEQELNEHDLVISDKEKAVAMAGVMGLKNSEIDENTETVIIESANFDPALIRNTANRFNLRTEAAIRFEKSLDPNLAETALLRAVNLIQEIIPEVEVVSEMIDEGSFSLEQCPIELTWDFINSRIGENLDQQLIIKNLENLGFTVKSTKKAIEVKIPTWRATKDVSIKEDIIEEITRIYGYDNLKPAMPTVAIEYREDNELRKLERKVKDILTQSCSANEVYCHSFVEESWLDKLGKNVNHVELSNPWSEGLGLMRQSLVPNLLQKAKENLRYFETINFFEVGKVFLKDQPGESIRFDSKDFLPAQPLMAVGIISQSDEENPYYIAKGIIEAIAERLQLKLEFFQTPDLAVWCHPKQSLEILIGKKVIGYFSTLHPKVNELMDCKNKIAIWQLNLSELLEVLPEVKKYQPLAKYPSVYLDLSIIVNEKVEWREIKSLVLSINTQIIKSVDLLDVFKNGKIESGKKSITFRTTYQSDERTLEMNEVEKIQKNIIEQLAKAVDAQVRK